MRLANLDNEVFFKKVFTDKQVFRAFVKDVADVDVQNPKIETEKQLDRPVAAIRFKLDIFAESEDHRVLVEIQRIDYDYSFDRFLHYFLAASVDLQRSSSDYAFKQDVYTIIVLTAPYIVKDKTGKLIQDEVLISDFNPRTLDHQMRDIYPHKLIFLNPNHPDDTTPQNIRDWLQLISESIKNPNDPNINLSNPNIKRAADIANLDNIPGSVLGEAKIAEARKKTKVIYEDIGREEREKEAIIGFDRIGTEKEKIAEALEISVEKVESVLNDHKKEQE